MRITPIILVGIALIVLGIVAFAYHGIPYTSREKVINVGSLHASVDTRKTIPMSPLLIRAGACRWSCPGRGRIQDVVLAALRPSTTGRASAKRTVDQFALAWIGRKSTWQACF